MTPDPQIPCKVCKQSPCWCGTLEARMDCMARFAEERCGHNPVSARAFETAIIDRFNALTTQVERLLQALEQIAYKPRGRRPVIDVNALKNIAREALAATSAPREAGDLNHE